MTGDLVWITGGSSGLGFAAAKRLVATGWRVAISGRDPDRLAAARDELGGNTIAIAADVTDAAALGAAVASLTQTGGPIRALVANAGSNVAQRAWGEVSANGFAGVLAANVQGTFNTIHAVLPSMREQGGGRIVAVSSFAGWHVTPQPGPAYTASKMAVMGMVMSLNMAEMRNRITATSLCPGEVATPAMARRNPPPSADALAAMLQPEDVAATISFILDQPSHVTINELVMTPTWNNAYNRVPGAAFRKFRQSRKFPIRHSGQMTRAGLRTGANMIYEMRTYTAHPGKLGPWLKVFEETRLPILLRHLGNLVGAFTPDTGTLNQLIQIWGYDDHADRARRRAALWADPEWLDPTKNTSDMLQKQESILLVPTRFSPLR